MNAKDTFEEFPEPVINGKKLTGKGALRYSEWQDCVISYDGCYCYGDNGPCHVCAHEGHPEALVNDPSCWEPAIDYLAINKEFSSK